MWTWKKKLSKVKFSIKDFFSKRDQIRSFLQYIVQSSREKEFVPRAVVPKFGKLQQRCFLGRYYSLNRNSKIKLYMISKLPYSVYKGEYLDQILFHFVPYTVFRKLRNKTKFSQNIIEFVFF